MSEALIPISNLNDFIFCPVSIYFHNLDYESDIMTYQCSDQLNGSAAHQTVDGCTYSTRQSVLTGIPVYSCEYGLYGKIDIFDLEKGVLTERKKKIKTVYDGYVFQLYAQYFSLIEMGYSVNKLVLYSKDDNKSYPILLPENNPEMYCKFKNLIKNIITFNMNDFVQKDLSKCNHCIYEPLCSFSVEKENI